MARSAVERLPEGARKSLEGWLGDFLAGRLSLDEVMDRLSALLEFNGLKADAPSRSSVHRYAQNFARVAERVKRSQAFAEMLAAEVGPQIADGKGLQVLLQAFQSLAYDMIGKMDEDAVLDPESLMFFARSLKDVASAQKTDADRAIAIEKAALVKAAARVEAVGKKAGWSADTARLVRAEILGIKTEAPAEPPSSSTSTAEGP